MLTNDDVRALLEQPNLTDAEVEGFLSALRPFIHAVLDDWAMRRSAIQHPRTHDRPAGGAGSTRAARRRPARSLAPVTPTG